jgi:hypothetical protein
MPKDRTRMRQDNPRGVKRGGRKYVHLKNLFDSAKFVWDLHLRFHHKKGLKEKDVCRSKRCPMLGKVI